MQESTPKNENRRFIRIGYPQGVPLREIVCVGARFPRPIQVSMYGFRR